MDRGWESLDWQARKCLECCKQNVTGNSGEIGKGEETRKLAPNENEFLLEIGGKAILVIKQTEYSVVLLTMT